MKKILLASTLIVAAAALIISHTAKAESPYPPWVDSLFGPGVREANQENEGTSTAKVVRFVYDTAVDGGTVAAHGLGVYLPAKAVIVRSYFKIITQFSDSGTGTVALSCEDANNIKTATDITGSSADAFLEGASTGASSAFVRGIAAPCEITATVATAAQDTGKLVGWVQYVLEN